jgi:hypothetical protein
VRRVAVYVGRGDQLASHYFLSFLGARWRAAGVELIVLDDPARCVDADAAIVHVNATHRPAGYDQVLQHYPRVINGRVGDISKTRISAQLVTRASDYSGPVIVKTNSNCFGIPDRKNRRRTERLQGLASRIADRLLPLRRSIRLEQTYPIYQTLQQVPRAVWWDPHFVVEKFLPERSDELYCLRTWMFFGPRDTVSLGMSREPVVKRRNTIQREFISEVPEPIREARRRLGFDYGKFDFVLHDGQPILLDTNSTPTCSAEPTPRLDAMADELARGLLEVIAAPSDLETPTA